MHGRYLEPEFKQTHEVARPNTWLYPIAQWLFNTKVLNASGNFLLGDLWKASGIDGKGMGEEIKNAAERAERDPDHKASLRFGPPVAGLNLHYIHAMDVPHLMKNQDKMHGHNPSGVFERVFGKNVIFTMSHNSPQRKPLRGNFQSRLFTANALKNLMDPMQQVANEYMQEIENAQGQIPDVKSLAELFTMKVIGETQLAFKKFGKNDQIQLSGIIDKVINKVANPKNSLPGLMVKGIELFDKYIYGKETLDELLDDGRELFTRLISQNAETILSTDNWISQVTLKRLLDPNSEKTGEEWKTVLKSDAAKKALHSQDVINDAALFLVVGHETSAKFFERLFLYLIDPAHKEHLDNIREEIKNKNLDTLTKEEMDQFVYLKAVFYEILRLCPPVPTINGQWSEDISFPRADGKELHMRAGEYFFVSPLHVQRDPAVWKDPLEFDPTRFLKKDATGKYIFVEPAPHTFFPFGFSSQSCPGQKFALQEAGILFLKLISKYDIAMNPENLKNYQEMSAVFSLRSDHRVSATAIEREDVRSRNVHRGPL